MSFESRKKLLVFDRMSEIVQNLTHVSAEGAKIKLHQFNINLTANVLICRGNGLSQCSLLCALGIYGLIRSMFNFCENCTLKTKIKHGLGTIIHIQTDYSVECPSIFLKHNVTKHKLFQPRKFINYSSTSVTYRKGFS